MRVAGFRAARHRFFGKVAMHLTPPERWLEIDEPADFARAEQILAERGPRVPAGMPTPLDALVLDFDGVFTDNAVYVAQDGTETVRCDRGDGLGLVTLRQAGLPILVLSKERNPVVHARCAKLGIPCLSGVDDKLPALTRWLAERGLSLARTIYVGNDVNDIECLRAVGFGAAPADAYPEALSAATLVLSRPGGRGAIRELTGLIHAHLEASRGTHA
jgi:N-acylneuraminate cytidylyltransferase